MGPIPPFLSLLPLLCGSAPAQVAPSKPAAVPPEAQAWIREHAADWEKGPFLAQRLREAKSVVLVVPAQPSAASMITKSCFEALLARAEAPLLVVPASWEEGRALDSWLADGKTAPGALLEKPLLDLARTWNADPERKKKLRAAGSDYRSTREAAVELTEFITRVDPQLEQRTGQLLGPFRQTGPDGRNRYDKVDETWRFAVQQLLGDLDGQVNERREEWEKIVGPQALAAGLRDLLRLRQAEQEVSKPDEFRRGRALCQNAAAAREELARGAALVALVPGDVPLEAREVREVLGEGALALLVLGPGEDRDFAALTGVRAGGALDLRELPKEGPVADWFAASLGKRADLVLWIGVR
jgi:hypothetical protein